jgi:hypothetical protein
MPTAIPVMNPFPAAVKERRRWMATKIVATAPGKVYTITLDGTMTPTDRRQCGRSKA